MINKNNLITEDKKTKANSDMLQSEKKTPEAKTAKKAAPKRPAKPKTTKKAAPKKAAPKKPTKQKPPQPKTAKEKAAPKRPAKPKTAKEKAAPKKPTKQKPAKPKTAKEKAAPKKPAKPKATKKKSKAELEKIKNEEKTFEEELEEQLSDEEIENFQIEKVDMEMLTKKVCDILVEKESDGMLQNDLWKKLKLVTRDGSRLALKLERMGTITRDKILENGRWTYKLILKKTPISTQSLENAPCLVCPVEQKCSLDGEISPRTCQLIEDWVITEMKKPKKTK